MIDTQPKLYTSFLGGRQRTFYRVELFDIVQKFILLASLNRSLHSLVEPQRDRFLAALLAPYKLVVAHLILHDRLIEVSDQINWPLIEVVVIELQRMQMYFLFQPHQNRLNRLSL